MQVVPLGPKRVKLSDFYEYKDNTKNVVKIPSTIVVQKREKVQNKLSWNNLFINQTFLLGTTILQSGVPKEWLNRSNNIERPFRAEMVMAKVEAIKRTKNRRAELVQAYKEQKALNDMANDDDTEEDDSSSESVYFGEEWDNYNEVNYITDKQLETVLRKIFEENTVWDFSYLKTRFNPDKSIYPMYCPCGKIHKPWLEEEKILSIIKEDLGDYGLCHKNKFEKRVSFFDHLRQKATSGSIIHYGLMQYLLILYPDYVKVPKKKQVSQFIKIEFNHINFKTFCIQR